MGDIDHFKNLNDTYGHETGDVVLKGLADIFTRSIRAEDTACRYGGEEFVIVLPNCDVTSALQKAELMRNLFKNTILNHQRADIKATISFGIAQYPVHGRNFEDILLAADALFTLQKIMGETQQR
jgi:diguanylate cyclase (GGDEF)-like protein